MKIKKKSGKTLRKLGKSQGKMRQFDGIKKWESCVESLVSLGRQGRKSEVSLWVDRVESQR